MVSSLLLMLLISESVSSDWSSFARLALADELLSSVFWCVARANRLNSCSGPHTSCIWLFSRQKEYPFLIVPANFTPDSNSALSRKIPIVFLIYLCQASKEPKFGGRVNSCVDCWFVVVLEMGGEFADLEYSFGWGWVCWGTVGLGLEFDVYLAMYPLTVSMIWNRGTSSLHFGGSWDKSSIVMLIGARRRRGRATQTALWWQTTRSPCASPRTGGCGDLGDAVEHAHVQTRADNWEDEMIFPTVWGTSGHRADVNAM